MMLIVVMQKRAFGARYVHATFQNLKEQFHFKMPCRVSVLHCNSVVSVSFSARGFWIDVLQQMASPPDYCVFWSGSTLTPVEAGAQWTELCTGLRGQPKHGLSGCTSGKQSLESTFKFLLHFILIIQESEH